MKHVRNFFNWAGLISWFRKTGFQVFGGLLMEEKGGVWTTALGRVAFWIVLGHCLYIWNQVTESVVEGIKTISRGDVSDNEFYTLMALLGYGGFKIGANAVKMAVSSKQGAPAVVEDDAPTSPRV